jgi:hypothetical protein
MPNVKTETTLDWLVGADSSSDWEKTTKNELVLISVAFRGGLRGG